MQSRSSEQTPDSNEEELDKRKPEVVADDIVKTSEKVREVSLGICGFRDVDGQRNLVLKAKQI